jgi:hypothetical protein
MIRIKVIDWRGNVYKVKVMAVPTVGEDLQVGVADDKRVRGVVSNVERTIGKDSDHIEVYLADDRNELNDGSTFEEVNWW